MARRSKSGQLVCQHLEGISRRALEQPATQRILRAFVARRHGVYALYRKNRLAYVGLASNLRSRLKQHLKDRHANSWDSFSVYITLENHHLRELESLLLRIADPSGNRAGGRFVRSEDLRRRFRRAIRDEHRRQLDGYFGKASIVDVAAPRDGGRAPALAKWIKGRGFPIRLEYKGRKYKARVLKTGVISYKGKKYMSPSLATKPITGRTWNGWLCWLYQRSPGEWVPLDTLR